LFVNVTHSFFSLSPITVVTLYYNRCHCKSAADNEFPRKFSWNVQLDFGGFGLFCDKNKLTLGGKMFLGYHDKNSTETIRESRLETKGARQDHIWTDIAPLHEIFIYLLYFARKGNNNNSSSSGSQQ
jgi:hypothetical protein